ncbi:PREDICTED: exocyst complex component EXO70B1-like [Ipomoea nil]|uniref:exocyst complex component EXO70B1-like n=1 Tax=Ipomoea nil TaxID=35883 RepID=UPI000901B8C2|nr:PREDICTED: exocyst complex component EXO70B1-like [Ipomoea nil]
MPRKGMRLIGFSPNYWSSSSTVRASPSAGSDHFYESVMERALEISGPMIMKWNPEASEAAKVTSLFYESRREANDFVKCVRNLQKAMQFLAMEQPRSEKLVRAQNLMEVAMKRLQKEFFQILNMNRAHLDPESSSASARSSSVASTSTGFSSTSDFDVDDDDDDVRVAGDSITEVEDVSSFVMADMRLIVECMISCGYSKECFKVYKDIRKWIIDEAISRLGVEKMSFSKIRKMDWEVLELRIKNWLSAMEIAVKTLFNGERTLCDNVFASTPDAIRESIFKEISKEAAMILFEFPENIAKYAKNSPEKVFRLLDMYNAIANHRPEIESIFSMDSASSIRTQAVTSLAKLGDAIRTGIAQFETVLQKDSSKSTVAGGGIHPLTIDAMNYLTSIADHSNVLSDIFSNTPPIPKDWLPDSYFAVSDSDESPLPAISLRYAWLILLLLCKLDVIAEHYKDISIAYLFLANNLQYVVVKVRTSRLNRFLGENWLSKQSAKVKQYAANYERLGWGDVIASLPENPTAPMSPEEIKQHFKKFNASFAQAHRKHSACVVSDRNLRDSLKVSLARKLLRPYRDFYDTHKLTMPKEKERHFSSIVKFAPEDVGHHLSDLFFEPSK